jgi:hypothetical protein
VVIELKRLDDGGHLELQGLRCAAMLSAMDFEVVVRTYSDPLAAQGHGDRDALKELVNFLGPDPVISRVPRLILVAPGFSQEITTTVLCLNEQALNIRCVQANLYELNGSPFLSLEQVKPLPSGAAYQVRSREKEQAQQQAESRKQRRSLTVDRGLLSEGTRIELIKSPRPGLDIADPRAKHATFIGPQDQRFRWDYDGEAYALSTLCRRLCEVFGGEHVAEWGVDGMPHQAVSSGGYQPRWWQRADWGSVTGLPQVDVAQPTTSSPA